MLTNLPYASNSFDLVFSSDVLEHIHEDEVCKSNKAIRSPCTVSRFLPSLRALSTIMHAALVTPSLRLQQFCVVMIASIAFPVLHQCEESDRHNRRPSCDGASPLGTSQADRVVSELVRVSRRHLFLSISLKPHTKVRSL